MSNMRCSLILFCDVSGLVICLYLCTYVAAPVCMCAQKTLARVHCDLFFGMDSASAEHGDGDGELYPGFCKGGK